jgi:hypothetical protein
LPLSLPNTVQTKFVLQIFKPIFRVLLLILLLSELFGGKKSLAPLHTIFDWYEESDMQQRVIQTYSVLVGEKNFGFARVSQEL